MKNIIKLIASTQMIFENLGIQQEQAALRIHIWDSMGKLQSRWSFRRHNENRHRIPNQIQMQHKTPQGKRKNKMATQSKLSPICRRTWPHETRGLVGDSIEDKGPLCVVDGGIEPPSI